MLEKIVLRGPLYKSTVRRAIKAIKAYDWDTPRPDSPHPITVFWNEKLVIEHRRPDDPTYKHRVKVLVDGWPIHFISEDSLLAFLRTLCIVRGK